MAPTTALLGGGEIWEVDLTGRSPDADACPQGLSSCCGNFLGPLVRLLAATTQTDVSGTPSPSGWTDTSEAIS